MTAAVVTVSDSARAGTRADLSGPAVAARLEAVGWTITAHRIVADERAEIAALLRELADGGDVQAVFTTGGTGIAPRDVTPEATRDVIDREFPGFGELMRADGRKFTPRAVLSRALAGARGGVFIVNLPGSPKGAVESLNVIVDLVPHTVDLLAGRTGHTPE